MSNELNVCDAPRAGGRAHREEREEEGERERQEEAGTRGERRCSPCVPLTRSHGVRSHPSRTSPSTLRSKQGRDECVMVASSVISSSN